MNDINIKIEEMIPNKTLIKMWEESSDISMIDYLADEMFNKLIKIGFTTGLTSKEKAFINSPFMFIDKGIIWCGADMDFFKKSSPPMIWH